jgi:acyl transferase domain-containing protein/thioesterase domain-containing protein/acyl carrier protein/SAM-dependent methyltransferase
MQDQLQEYCVSLLLAAFRRMGVFRRAGETHEIEALSKRLHIIPEYRRLFPALLRTLARAGCLTMDGTRVATTSRAESLLSDAEIEVLFQQPVKVKPEFAAHAECLRVCLQSYPETLTGKRNHLEVLFPNGSMSRMEAIYKSDTAADACGRLTAELIGSYVRAHRESSPHSTIRILEAGAGTGATSALVLPVLARSGADVEFFYTDLSPAFLEHGRRAYGAAYPFVRLELLDLEKAPSEQGFTKGRFDLIFACNVLHATRNIGETLNHLKWLLRPKGILAITEVTQAHDFATLIFGLTSGWWRYQDEHNRIPDSPLLTADSWRRVLAEAGFQNSEDLSPPSGQWTVLAAESDGQDAEQEKQPDPPSTATQPALAATAGREPAASESILAAIRSAFSDVLRVPPSRIRLDSTFEKYGVDSLVALELNKRLERDFGPLPAALLFEYDTAAKLAAYLSSLKADLSAAVPPPSADGEPANDEAPRLVETERAAKHQRPPGPEAAAEPIAIVGLAGRYPLADSPAGLWTNLRAGRNCVRPFPPERLADLPGCGVGEWHGGFLDRIDAFDAPFFGIAPAEADYMDPQERLWIETAWHAVEDAGYTPARLERMEPSGRPAGVFVGCMYSQYPLATADPAVAAHLAAGGHWSIANRTSYLLHLRGPSIAVDTACSSSLTAIHLACQSIRLGECGAAIAGGVNLTIHPGKFGALRAAGILADGYRSRAFGQGGGLLPGEGVGAVVLKPLSHAIADGDFIYGVVLGSSANHGGKTSGYRVPSAEAQGESIAHVLRQAGIAPESLSYIEAAANGSPLGDPLEISGLRRGLGAVAAGIGSIKSNIGHLEAASGISQLTKVLGQLRDGMLYPTIHSEPRNPELGMERTALSLVTQLQPWDSSSPRRAAIGSFGVGGANAHLIVEEYVPATEAISASPGQSQPELIVLSAHSEEQLRAHCEQLLDCLTPSPPARRMPRLCDIAFTLQTGREALPDRLAVVVGGIEELRSALQDYLHGEADSVLRGRQAENDGFGDAFAGGAGRQFFESMRADRDFLRAARLWVRGVDVDWEPWHAGRAVRRTPLPGYPFAQRRCWIGPSPAAQQPLHPLVHRDISRNANIAFSSRFTGAEVFFAQHRIAGQAVMPAAALLEMARYAAETAGGAPVTRLARLAWTRPLRVSPGHPAEVEVHLQRTPSGEFDFQILGGVETIASGTAGFGDLFPNCGAPPDEAGESPIGLADPYADFLRAGLELGPHFRSIQSMRREESGVYATLALRESLPGCAWQPGLLDGVLQSLAGFRENEETPALEAPYWIDRIEVMGPLEAEAWVLAKRDPGPEGSFEILVWNGAGSPALRLSGVATRSLHLAEPAAEQGAEKLLSGTICEGFVSGYDFSRAVKAIESTWSSAPEGCVPPIQSEAPSFSAARETKAESLEQALARLVGEILRLQVDEVPLNRPFLDFGFDSASLVTFARRIAESLGIDLSPAELFARPTIRKLAVQLQSKARLRPAPQREAPAVDTGRVRLAARMAVDEPIAIIGMSAQFPGSKNIAAFWEHLLAGADLVSEVPADRWDWRQFGTDTPARWGGFLDRVDLFDPLFFGISPREAAMMDPQHRLFLETVWHAIEDAGYAPSQLAGTRTGLFAGVATSDYADLMRGSARGVESQMSTGIAHSILANRISYLLDLRGLSQPIDTACSSSLVAIHHGVEAIRKGSCDLAIAGGVNVILSPVLAMGFGKAGFMSPSGRCKAFGAGADGYVRGEGAGAILLKPLSRAIEDGDSIHAVIRAAVVNHGGRSASLTAPNSQAQTELLKEAWRQASVDAASIGYIEAHGTGTALGDPIEVLGIADALQAADGAAAERKFPCWLGSVKSNFGHLEAAAGIAGIVKTILALKHETIPPTLHAEALNPHLPLSGTAIRIASRAVPWPHASGTPRRGGVSSFGFGGTNAHVLLEEAPEGSSKAICATGPSIAVLSARTSEQVRVYARELADYLERAPALSLQDVCFTLCTGREAMESRWAAEVHSIADLEARLRKVAEFGAEQEAPPASAQAWVSGKGKLPETTGGRRVSLPGYPFARVSHWFQATLAEPAKTQRTGRIVLRPGDPRIAHHRVGGQLVCAGAVLVDETIRQVAPESGICLSRWNWLRPVMIGNDPAILAVRRTENAIQIEAEDGAICAQGELGTAEWKDETLAVPSPGAEISAANLYEVFAAEGVAYGEWFRRILSLRETGNDVWARFELPFRDQATPRADLLDAAMQAASFLHLSRSEPGLPHALFQLEWSERIQSSPAAGPWSGWIHANDHDGRLNFEIANAGGQVFIRLRELILRPLPEEEAIACSKLEWQPDQGEPLDETESGFGESRWIVTGAEPEFGEAVASSLPHAEYRPLDESFIPESQDSVCYVAPLGVSADASSLHPTAELLEALRRLSADGGGDRPLALTVVTRGAQQLEPREARRHAHAGVSGLAIAAAREHMVWTVRTIDLATDASPAELASVLRREGGDAFGRRIAYRDGRRFVQRLVSQEAAKTGDAWRPQGVYLVTGAYGYIGSALARHLSLVCKARLVLVSRRQPGERELRMIDQLRELGAEVLPLAADLRDSAACREIVDRACARFGQMHGVFHAAMVQEDRMLSDIAQDSLRRVCAPKYEGTLHLCQALAGHGLDFLCVFSSIASVSGSVGQANYVAASALQDSAALAQGDRLGLPVRVIDWGYWENGGAGERARRVIERMGIDPILPREGFAWLRHWLSSPGAKQIVATRKSKTEEIAAPRHKRAASAEAAAGRLSHILSELLSIPAAGLDRETPLERYGVDSLVTLELSKSLEAEFGRVSPADIFENRTISALAGFLANPETDEIDESRPAELLTFAAEGRQSGAISSYWVHGAPGYAQVFRPLAQDTPIPVYAFQARGIDGFTPPFTDFGAMADYYCECMRRTTPGRPVILGGYSLGGVVALEVARRWRSAGNPVAHLVLLDTYPNAEPVRQLFSNLRDQGFYQIMLANMFLAARGYAPVPLTEADLNGIPAESRLSALARMVSERNKGALAERDVYRALVGTSAVSNATGEAFRRFSVEPYDASEVLFIRAARGFVLPENGQFTEMLARFGDYDYIATWRHIVRAPLTVETIDSDHFSLLGPVHAEQVRSLVRNILADSTKRSS